MVLHSCACVCLRYVSNVATFIADALLPFMLGWSGGAMVLGKLPVLQIWLVAGQGPTVLRVGAVGGCLDIFSLIYHFYLLSPSVWETVQYRQKYCLKGPLNPNNQPTTNPYMLCYEK